jgi:hypothetical protein
MRVKVEGIALLLALGMAAGAHGQTQGQNQGSPMNGDRPTLDTSRVQSELELKAAAGTLKISFGKKSAEWTPATLAPLPHVTLTVHNEHVNSDQTYTGVPLIELLKPLGVPDKPKDKEFRFYVEAEGSDGYVVVYSVGEVTPDVHDATVMVADAMDGKAIGDSGPMQLVATGEKRPARWVRNLVAVRVMEAK